MCAHRTTKARMSTHLSVCIATHGGTGSARTSVVLRFDAPRDPRYWAFVEARADAPLRLVDAFLRKLWLECCGHLSAFRAASRELAMGVSVERAFASARTLRYEYDFGSTTELTGTIVSTRHGPTGRAVVRLLARNEPIEWSCATCAAPATVVCPFCMDTGDDHLFCDAHAGAHAHATEEVYLPVVNSPRMGVCGYAG